MEKLLSAVQSVCRGDNHIFGINQPSAQWLVQPPRTGLVLSPDAIRSAFFCQFLGYFDKDDDGFGDTCLIIPSHFLRDRGLVLGTMHLRADRATLERMPQFLQPDSVDVLHEMASGCDASLSRFVLDLVSGRLYHLTRSANGNFTAGAITFGSHGITDLSVGSVTPDGDVMARMRAVRECGFCQAHGEWDPGRGCVCPPAMRQRAQGSRVSLGSWGHLLDLGRANYDKASYVVCENVTVFPELVPQRETVDFGFAADARVLQARAAYVNHLTVLTLSIVSPIASSSTPTTTHDLEKSESTNGTFMDIDDLATLSLTANDSGDSIEVLASEILDWSLVPASAQPASLIEDGPRPDSRPRAVAASAGAAPRGRRPKSPPVCKTCSKRFAKHHNLQRHIAATHDGRKQFECDLCSARFSQAGNLKRHRQAVHERRRPYACELCGAEFGSQANLTRHRTCKHEEQGAAG